MRKHEDVEPLFSPEVAKNLQFRLSDEESVRVLDAVQSASGFAGEGSENAASVSLTVWAEPVERPQRKREHRMSPSRWSSLAAATVVVMGLGAGSYIWHPWTKSKQPDGPIVASTKVQSAYRKRLDFVPVVPAQLPQGYKVKLTEVLTDKSPTPTAAMKRFYASYSYGKNDVLNLEEGKQSIPEPFNGVPTSRVKMSGTTVTVGNSSPLAQANFHLYGVYISAVIVNTRFVAGKGTGSTSAANAASPTGALHRPNATKQRQELLSFVKNMIRRPAQAQQAPTYINSTFEGKSAATKVPFQAVTPSVKALGQYHPMGFNGGISQLITRGHHSWSDIFYLYSSGTDQIGLNESQGAYQRLNGSWKRAADLGTVSGTVIIDGQKVYRGKNGLSMKWIEPKQKVVFSAVGMSKADQAQLQKVMASIIEQALAVKSPS